MVISDITDDMVILNESVILSVFLRKKTDKIVIFVNGNKISV